MRTLLALALAVLADAQNPRIPPRDAPPARPVGTTASISGRVTDADSGRPLSDATVHLTPANDPEPDPVPRGYEGATDADGRYTLDAVAPGVYVIHASPGLFRATHRQMTYGRADSSAGRPPATTVTLAAGESRRGVDFPLPRAFAIEGRVVNDLGEPIADARLHAERLPAGVSMGLDVYSDDRGMYRLYRLPPGTYRVCAQPFGFRMPAEPTDAAQARYFGTCHPAATTDAAAQPVEITNADRLGIDIQMQRSRTYVLSGQVVTTSGGPPRDIHVSVSPVGRLAGMSPSHPHVTETSFTARGLTPGEYRVQAFSGDGDDQEMGGARVRIESSDVVGLVVTTSKGARVRGRIEFDGARPAAAALRQLRVHAVPDPFAADRLFDHSPRSGPIDEALAFSLRGIFEPAVVTVQGLPDGWALRAVTHRGADITHRATRLTSSDSPDAVVIVLTGRTARLRVRPLDSQGHAGPPDLLVVLPADRSQWPGGLRLGRSVSDGVVDFGAFAPGEYLVAAYPPDGPGAPSDHLGTLERMARSGQRVTLAEGQVLVADFRMPVIGAIR